ncbi:hypothetical protein C2S51_038096 [Perilla frutescens var. frutescens]|nr:hypothetical protein C2S51_038096 [Perilla frutescens var. frutescens]
MSKAEEMKLHIKVVMNEQKTKVLFAEAGSDFTDVLLSFLLLPLGTILKVMEKQYGDKAPVIGSLSTLYNGVVNLDNIHFQSEAAKQSLLFPASCYESEARKLRLNVNYPQPTSPSSRKAYDGVYTDCASSFIISDDLQVMPNVAGSFMKTLSSLGIAVADMDGAETKNVTFGLNEILALLRGSMVSRNPLTALLCGSQIGLASGKSRLGNAILQVDPKVMSKNTKKMILKVVVLKSNNKLLFAQADCDFINFLFGMLTVPIGRIEWYFGSNTGLKSVDNLHRSIADESKKLHLKSADIKGLLIKSTVPTNFPITSNEFSHLNFDPDAKNHHVKGVRMYMVSNDLTVAPLAMTSCLYVINELKVSVSDVEEVELQVGLEEGLSILKAALTSTTALTDGLIKHISKSRASLTSNSAITDGLVNQMTLMKRPKLEC